MSLTRRLTGHKPAGYLVSVEVRLQKSNQFVGNRFRVVAFDVEHDFFTVPNR